MRMITTIFIVLALALSFGLADDAFAKKKKRKKKKKKKKKAATEYVVPYGMAGCGLGSMVIKSNDIMQIFAGTSNGTSGNQTFGITSGTSNCKPASSFAAMEQEVFVESNLANLTIQAAQGKGDHLFAFAELLGCDHSQFANFSRKNFVDLYDVKNAKTILQKYHAGLVGCERSG